mgnify:CR=1 FL=1
MARLELEMVPSKRPGTPIQFRAQGEARVPSLTSTREPAVRESSIRSWGTLGCPREIGLHADVPADEPPRLKALSRHWKSMTSPGVASACSYIQALRMSDRFGEDSALKSYCYFPQALEPVVQT